MKRMLTTVFVLTLFASAPPASAQTPASTQAPAADAASKPVGTSGLPAVKSAVESTPTKPAAVAADYRLVPGDKLRIEVYKDAQLSQNVQIRPDGKITLPLANDVAAAGRTPSELRETITSTLKPFITNPTVTVIVVETVPPVIYVMGEVNTAGPQPLVGRLDVLQALAAAGGFKDFANTKNIKIRRGSNEVLQFNYKEAINGRVAPLYLKPGDTIIVP